MSTMDKDDLGVIEIMDEETKSEEDQKERQGWQGTMDFILTCIGYAVGLGNIWRFPYLCYKSGGGFIYCIDLAVIHVLVDTIDEILDKLGVIDTMDTDSQVWGRSDGTIRMTGNTGLHPTWIGYAVGLGNIWMFPYLCYKSGGGAFFIPYVLFLVMCGVPLFFLETVYGQFASLSPITIWRMSPLFKGVGIGMVIVSALVCVYYNVIVAWTIYYLFMSVRAVLPWSTCGNWWNTRDCLGAERSVILASAPNSSEAWNMTTNQTGAGYSEIYTKNASSQMVDFVSSSEEFWERHVLQLSSGIEEPEGLRWQLVITLALAWILVFFCLFQGVHVLGKIMHFCAPFPYLVLLVLLVRGVTLDGALDGIKFYIIPRWEKLATFQVWGDAALQIFYSVGMGWGGIVTMASYNNFKHNVYRDAMIVPIINCCTSIFAGFVIFSILGFMAHQTGKSVEDVVKQGPGLTFVAYPEAVSLLPVSPLWAVLFFLMLLVVGIDSQFGMVETCLSSVIDEFPRTLRNKRVLVAAIGCFIEFLLGLPLVTKGGIYILQIIDWYCASFSLMVISFTECIAISWVYGVDRFYKDIELMIGYQPSRLWSYLWRFVTPAIITFVWLFSIITLGPVTYGDVTYPGWAVTFGWCLGAISIVPLPACAIYSICQEEGSLLQRLKKLSQPSKDWGPREPAHREEYVMSLAKTRTEDLPVVGVGEETEHFITSDSSTTRTVETENSVNPEYASIIRVNKLAQEEP